MKIAFLGTGLLGAPMAARLHDAGVRVRAWNRTAARAAPLRETGVNVVDDVREAVSGAEATLLMLADAPAINTVLATQGVAQALRGQTLVQMGTIAPGESRDLANRCTSWGASYLEAPVLGSIPQAQAGTLQVMVGGDEALLARWSSLLAHFGPVRRVGAVGEAATLKLALNQLIASLTAAFSASLGLVRREGVDVDLFLDILRKSALYAPTFDKKLGRMMERDFGNPNFPTRHMLKDVNLFLDAANGVGLGTEGVAGVARVIEAALKRGVGDLDYSALYVGVDPD